MKKRDYKERLEWKEGFKDVKQKRRKLELSSESEFNAQKHWRQICRINFRSETLSVSDVLRVAPGLRYVRHIVLRPHPALRSRVDSLVSPQFWSPPAEKTFQLPHQSVDQTERIISIMTLSNLLLLKVNTSWFVSSSVKVN